MDFAHLELGFGLAQYQLRSDGARDSMNYSPRLVQYRIGGLEQGATNEDVLLEDYWRQSEEYYSRKERLTRPNRSSSLRTPETACLILDFLSMPNWVLRLRFFVSSEYRSKH